MIILANNGLYISSAFYPTEPFCALSNHVTVIDDQLVFSMLFNIVSHRTHYLTVNEDGVIRTVGISDKTGLIDDNFNLTILKPVLPWSVKVFYHGNDSGQTNLATILEYGINKFKFKTTEQIMDYVERVSDRSFFFNSFDTIIKEIKDAKAYLKNNK